MAKRAEEPGNPLFPGSPEKKQPADTARPDVGQVRAEAKRPSVPTGRYTLPVLLGIIVTCLVLIYFVVNAHHRISDVGLSLLKTRGELASMIGRVDDSRDQVSKLSNGLNQTRDETAEQGRQLESHSALLRQQQAEYRRLSAGVRKMRAEYRRELRAMEQEKADRSDVKQLQQGLESLKNETDTLKQKVTQSEVPRPENTLVPPSTPAASPASADVAPIKHEQAAANRYYFELQEKDGLLWLLNVGLDLKKVKISDSDAKYDLEVRVDGNKIRKKDGHLNEPILVPVPGSNQPYRLVVTKIDKDQVTGFLSVPKV